jgi:hypothetical protein
MLGALTAYHLDIPPGQMQTRTTQADYRCMDIIAGRDPRTSDMRNEALSGVFPRVPAPARRLRW